jgi:hypothetical protein
MGAIIVEIVDDKLYHFRQVQADRDGAFIDIGVRYMSESIEDVPPEAIVLGDWHAGEVDPSARKSWYSIIKTVKPKHIVIHDVFNGLSINHHEEDDIILRAQRAMSGQLNLREEVEMMVKDINEFTKRAESVVIVKSNHDKFLERYLRGCKYMYDPHNHRFSLDLAIALMDDKDPLRVASEMCDLKRRDKIRWLQEDEDFVVARVQLGSHGDRGANGTKGTVKSIENTFGNSVTGHLHSPEILRGAYVVGTSSYLKVSYNRGPSSWWHTSCLVYPNGSRQLINSVNGEWRSK